MRPYLLWMLLAVAFALSLESARGQSAGGSDIAQTGVVLSTLSPPIYPPLARLARISGEVELKLGIRRDGSIESAVAVSGHPMLQPAALDSAQHSRFECRGCSDEVTSYSLIYSFRFATETRIPANQNGSGGAEVVQSQNRVTITAELPLIYIYFASIQVRSAKCLYLWRCGSHWSGEEYYFYRVRSAKCLYMWKCGLRRRGPPVPRFSR